MKTIIKKASEESVEEACRLIKSGDVVAVPTETVYGIAANAFDGEAIKKIFKAKGRPQDNPLIVHISDMDMLNDVVKSVPKDAYALADAFWPGPLTMIMPKGDKVAEETCAGLDSVGVRMPSNPIAHEIILRSGLPFAAPSANISGRPSPTNAADVFFDMDGRLPLIIDGGECFAGVESTVVSLLGENPIVLRPGYITKEDMQAVLGKEVLLSAAITQGVKDGDEVLSPGMKYKHYAPNAQVYIVDGDFDAFKAYVCAKKGDGVFCLCFDGEEKELPVECVTYGKKERADEQAHNLFNALRRLDDKKASIVYARRPDKSGVGLAVYNRLIRAAAFRVIKL